MPERQNRFGSIACGNVGQKRRAQNHYAFRLARLTETLTFGPVEVIDIWFRAEA